MALKSGRSAGVFGIGGETVAASGADCVRTRRRRDVLPEEMFGVAIDTTAGVVEWWYCSLSSGWLG